MKSPKSFGKPKKPKLFLARRVVGNSMLPGLRPGSIVIGWTHFGRLRIGNVVIIHHDGLEKIKRIAEIQDDRLFVVGDNEAESLDSRSFGWLPAFAVQAKIVWPRLSRTVATNSTSST